MEALHPFLSGSPLHHLVIAHLAAFFVARLFYTSGDAGWLCSCSFISLGGVGGLLCVIEVKGVFLFCTTMKFMKLGSKPDSFQTDGNNVR